MWLLQRLIEYIINYVKNNWPLMIFLGDGMGAYMQYKVTTTVCVLQHVYM